MHHHRPAGHVFLATSLDGCIARADGGIDWLGEAQDRDFDYGFMDFFATVDTVVLGRKTYDTALGFGGWPYRGKRSVVLTHRPPAPRADEQFFAGPPQQLLEKLCDDGARKLYIDGGEVIRQFLASGLIDEMTLTIVPVLLGDGIRLFSGGVGEQGLDLVATRSWPNGIVQLHYATSR